MAKVIYQMVQKIRGEKVFETLQKLEESQWYSKQRLEEIQWEKIKKIIAHAYDNVPYYRQKFDEYGITPNKIKDFTDLKHIPILTKEELRTNSHRLIARDRTYRFSKDSTSGSSGPATIVYTDRNALAFQHAAVFRAYHWMGVEINDRFIRFWGTQLDYKRKLKDRIRDFVLNRMTFSTHFLDKHSMFRYYKQFKTFRPSGIYGFTSAIYEFAKFIMENQLPIGTTKAVVVTGEPLFLYQRELIASVFGCNVYNEYGCAEFGPIAYECPAGRLHIMAENLYVEVGENGHILSDCKTGDLIITELNNFGMPIIRYRLGDVGILTNEKCTCGRGLPILKDIFGRTVSFIQTPEGNIIHGISFDYLPKYFLGEIRQFQMVQESPGHIKINVVKDLDFNEHTIKKFERKLRKVIGQKIETIFVFKERIPRENTGKYRFVISKMD